MQALSDLHVCYEASGCGFWIARRLLQMGVRCEVIAPSLIPTRSGNRVKTDKRDAAKVGVIWKRWCIMHNIGKIALYRRECGVREVIAG